MVVRRSPLRVTLEEIAGEVSERMVDGLDNPPGIEGGGEEDDNDDNGEAMMLQRQLSACDEAGLVVLWLWNALKWTCLDVRA